LGKCESGLPDILVGRGMWKKNHCSF